jgi:hypothetical protein
MALRGAVAVRSIKDKGGGRSRGGFTRRLMVDKDKDKLVRYRGLMEAPVIPSAEDLAEYTVEQLRALAVGLQASYAEDWEPQQVIESIVARLGQVEPFCYARHYISRNAGRKGLQAYNPCADPEVALLGDIFKDPTMCRHCVERAAGDKGVGYPQPVFNYSVWDYEKVHQVTEGEEKKYEACTLADTNVCKHCSRNRKVGEKGAGYAPLFDNGMRYHGLATKYSEQLLACARRVAKYCRHVTELEPLTCCGGKITPSGAACPSCGEDFDWDDLIGTGWLPDEPTAIVCGSCEEKVVPDLALECSGCDEPERARLCDVDVLVGKTGEDTSTAWSFSEQLPPRLLDPDDEVGAKVLAALLPDYEKMDECKPQSIEVQLKNLGKVDDPLGEELAPAPTVGRKGTVTKGGPASAVAGGVKKAAGGVKKAGTVVKRPGTSMFTRRV